MPAGSFWFLLLLLLLLLLAPLGQAFLPLRVARQRRPALIKMVEGHGVARVAAAHRRLLLNHAFKATSPNGRFAEGARLIDGRRLARIENVGKNLFYFFARTPQSAPSAVDPVVVHIHFGMSGAFTTRRVLVLLCVFDYAHGWLSTITARRVVFPFLSPLTPHSPPIPIHSPLPGKSPTPTTRLLLVNEALDVTASLSAMTVVHGGVELFEASACVCV